MSFPRNVNQKIIIQRNFFNIPFPTMQANYPIPMGSIFSLGLQNQNNSYVVGNQFMPQPFNIQNNWFNDFFRNIFAPFLNGNNSVDVSYMQGNELKNFQSINNPYLNFRQNSNNNKVSVKEATENAINVIKENFEELNLPEDAKKYLANIEFANEPFGTARAENGKIIVNANNNNVNSTDMVKVLIHESLHCVNNSPFSTIEEEFDCEKKAIQATAKLIEQGKIEDFQIYSSSMKNLGAKENEKLLDSKLETWLQSGGYDNRILDKDGNVNIEQYSIQKDDVIKINGKEYGKIGNYFLEGIQSSSICQLFSVNSDNKPTTTGIVVFDETEQSQDDRQRFLSKTDNPQKIEIVRDGKIICTGTIYNSRIF